MILGFMTKWPKTKEPTLFREKILQSLYLFFNEEVAKAINPKSTKPEIIPLKGNNEKPKHHTIRVDSKDRWKAGRDIHFYTGRYEKGGRTQFAPVVKCISVQKIEIKWKHRKYNGGEDYLYNILVDGKAISEASIRELAINDGFESVGGFAKYFYGTGAKPKDFVGKIIHWTDLKY